MTIIGEYNHKICDGDFTAILDSLNELFQERGDCITPKDLALRMQQKLRRNIHYNFATYLFSLLGFVTRSGIGSGDRDCRYIVCNAELLAEKRAQFCKLSEDKN